MKVQTTGPFVKDYHSLPETVQIQAEKQLSILLENPHHPSLRIKKIKGHPYIWEKRISKSYRFTFQIYEEIYLLRRIGTHDILKTP
jgi:mRNA interferase RelE/StbE